MTNIRMLAMLCVGLIAGFLLDVPKQCAEPQKDYSEYCDGDMPFCALLHLSKFKMEREQ